jgi:hypothetical protein
MALPFGSFGDEAYGHTGGQNTPPTCVESVYLLRREHDYDLSTPLPYAQTPQKHFNAVSSTIVGASTAM